MNKTFLLLISFFGMATLSFGQKENNIWYFGDHAGLDFNGGTPVSLTNSAMGQKESEGCSSVCDAQTGSLLFYTDGTTVWNKNHAAMPNGLGLNGSYSSTQSSVIVHMPGDPMKFYIFTADCGGYCGLPNRGLFYSIVDMTLDGGLGDVILTSKNTALLAPPATEKIAASSNCRGDSIWVVGHAFNSNNFYAWLVTGSGISNPVISGAGSVHTGDTRSTAGYMKISPDRKKIALAVLRSTITELFDFDAATGAISNPLALPTPPNSTTEDLDYGVCFSPNSSRLYIATTVTGTIRQYDLSLGTPTLIRESEVIVFDGHTIPATKYGALEIAPNGKIYASVAYQPHLDVINDPDSLGLSCNFVFNKVHLSGGNCAYGLPNIVKVETFTPKLDFTMNVRCFGDTTIFTDKTSETMSSYEWRFGDLSSGPSDTSRLRNPSHYYSQPGTYTVVLIAQKKCFIDTINKIITVPPPVVAHAGNDVVLCPGDTTQLHATGGSTYYWTPFAGLNNRTIPNPIAYPAGTTKYTVKVTDSNGCSNTDSVIVTVLPAFTYTAAPNPVNLGVTNIGTIKNGMITFTNTSSMNVRIDSFHFANAKFIDSIVTSFPTNLSAGNSMDIHFTAAPPSEGVFTGELCIEVDSACPATVCIPVKIEGVGTCLKPNVTKVVGEKPGDVTTIPIIVDPSTKFTTAKTITLTIKYNQELLRLIDLTSPIGKVSTTPSLNGEVLCTITVDSTIATPTATLADMHVQALLAPYRTGTIDVTTSNFTLQSGEQLSGASCPAEFTLGESCVHQNELKHRSSVSLEGIYPNPSYTKTTLVVATKNNPQLRIDVYDTFGRQVEVLHDGEISDGNHEVAINTQKYSNGIYFCRLIHNGQITTRAFNVER